MSPEQKNLIKKLKDDNNITIKKADKGAAVVILYTREKLP